MLGWEMLKIKIEDNGVKVAIFKNVDTGEVIEKDFFSLVANPPSKPHTNLVEGGLTDADGLVNVNPYTL